MIYALLLFFLSSPRMTVDALACNRDGCSGYAHMEDGKKILIGCSFDYATCGRLTDGEAYKVTPVSLPECEHFSHCYRVSARPYDVVYRYLIPEKW